MAKKIGLTFGIIFLVVGLLGFINNPIVGSNDAFFHADTAHNIVHLVTGLLFIIVAASMPQAMGRTLKVFAVIYLLVAILGFLSPSGSVLGIMAVNGHDNWLHVVLALVIWWGGMKAGKGGIMANNMNMGGMNQ
ncbi:DUF4383 domain-containing protein [Candidatus Parcubacteria bacterium]|nr:DUF4383 domain-containing protein [Candidatus Parcubacteria bacterium]